MKEKATNQETLREVLPQAEALKVKLLEQYRAEAAKYLADAKERERAERERLEKEKQRYFIIDYLRLLPLDARLINQLN